jgi:hypothetical protein
MRSGRNLTPFADLAAHLTPTSVRAAASTRPTSISSPSPNRRPAPVSARERPAEVSFDHLNEPDQAEAFARWQAEQRHETAQRGWERAIEASGVLGNSRLDGRSSAATQQTWSEAFAQLA